MQNRNASWIVKLVCRTFFNSTISYRRRNDPRMAILSFSLPVIIFIVRFVQIKYYGSWHKFLCKAAWWPLGNSLGNLPSELQVKVTRPLYSPRGLNAWGSCSGDRENVMGVGKLLLRCVCSGAHGGTRGAGAYRVATRTACLFRP